MATTPSLTPDSLAALAELAEAGFRDRRPGACLLRARDLGDEVELGWRPVEGGAHPLDDLAGFVAPDDWTAIGVAATGFARHLARREPRVPVRTVHLVARDGTWASRWTVDDDHAGTAAALDELELDAHDHAALFRAGLAAGSAEGGPHAPGRPIGRIDDACRRALGIPTGEPPASTAELWAVQWLDAVVEAALAQPARPVTWARAARRHPATHALAAELDRAPDPHDLVGLARRLAALRSWPALRQSAERGTWEAPEGIGCIAGWLDDAAFARWCLGAHPDLPDLLVAIAGVLPAPVARQVEAVLRGCEVLPP